MADAIIRVRLNASKAPASSSYTVFAGNTVELTFVITSGDSQSEGEPEDLTGWTLKYKLRPTGGGDVWPGGKTVTAADQTVNPGQCILLLEASDTAGLANAYNHYLVLTDAAGKIGTFMIGTATFTTNGV